MNLGSYLLRTLACAVVAVGTSAYAADPVGDWNRTLMASLVATKANPLLQSRHAAVVHVAMAEAVNATGRRWRPFVPVEPAPAGASADAAVATAAHRSLLALMPQQRELLDKALVRSLQAVPDGAAKSDGVAAGERAAQAVLVLRTHDGIDAQIAYQPRSGVAVWMPAPQAKPLGVHWGAVKPWAMASADAFRPAAPPEITSEGFARDQAEVMALGGADSAQRSEEQTGIAKFWITSGPLIWSQAAAQWTQARALPLAERARLFALLHAAGADALIACWDAKYHYQLWRPVDAARAAGDTAWRSAVPTPPFPAYPSGHACYAGAAVAVLGAAFGDGPLPEVVLKSPTAPGFERRHTRVADIATEVSQARIWGGIHWRSDQTAGEALGRRVGEQALVTLMVVKP